MTVIAIVDHGAGNLVSISQGLERVGAEVVLARSPGQLAGAAGIVVPGVGSMGAVMAGIRSAGFDRAFDGIGVPLLGICVGMQVLFDESDEDGSAGLGLLPGRVERLIGAPRLPHIGWNDVTVVRSNPLFPNLGSDPTFSFVHSYAARPEDPAMTIATAEYGAEFCAAVQRGLVMGVQFHPERSGRNGLRLLANFAANCKEAGRAA